jgi:hypothetical protein
MCTIISSYIIVGVGQARSHSNKPNRLNVTNLEPSLASNDSKARLRNQIVMHGINHLGDRGVFIFIDPRGFSRHHVARQVRADT